MGANARSHLVEHEGPQASVCLGVSYCPRVSRYPRGHSCDFSAPEFPGNRSFEYHSHAEMSGLVPGPNIFLSISPSLEGRF